MNRDDVREIIKNGFPQEEEQISLSMAELVLDFLTLHEVTKMLALIMTAGLVVLVGVHFFFPNFHNVPPNIKWCMYGILGGYIAMSFMFMVLFIEAKRQQQLRTKV